MFKNKKYIVSKLSQSLVCVSLLLLSFNAISAPSSNVKKRATTVRRTTSRTPAIVNKAASLVASSTSYSTQVAEPTKEEYNTYYNALSDLEKCMRMACVGNTGLIPSKCFNPNVIEQMFMTQCASQYTATQVIHQNFENKAKVEIQKKMLAESKKACDGLMGKYVGGQEPNELGEYLEFGNCVVTVGYGPKVLNNGQSSSDRILSKKDLIVGQSKLCDLTSFGVDEIDMMSEGNNKQEVNFNIQTWGAVASLGVDAAGALVNTWVASDFKNKNGFCTGRNGKKIEGYTKTECEDAGFTWTDYMQEKVDKLSSERDEAYQALESGCASRNGTASYRPYLIVFTSESHKEEMIRKAKSNLKEIRKNFSNYLCGNTPDSPKCESEEDMDNYVENNESKVYQTASGATYFPYDKDKNILTRKEQRPNDLESYISVEECLCRNATNDINTLTSWTDNYDGTYSCYIGAEADPVTVRVTDTGKEIRSVSDNGNSKYYWHKGPYEVAMGAYSDAMLTQFVAKGYSQKIAQDLSQTGTQSMFNLGTNTSYAKAASDTINSLKNPTAGGNTAASAFSTSIMGINQLQKMQDGANKKYNAAASAYESAVSATKTADEAVNAATEEQSYIDDSGDFVATIQNITGSTKFQQTVGQWSLLNNKSQFDDGKILKTGMCFIVTPDNTVGPVLGEEGENIKIEYSLINSFRN